MKRTLCKMAAFVLTINIFVGNAYAAGIQNFSTKNNVSNMGFCDVSSSQWYYNDVKQCYKLGLMNGKSQTAFDPNGSLTVGEAIALAARVHNIYNGGNGTIANTGDKWYDGCVKYAASNGIINKADYPNCDKKATRAELAGIFANALPKSELDAINNVTSLPDVTASTACRTSIYLLYNAGVLTGCDSKGTYKPSTTINRAEACAIINRLAVPSERETVTLKPSTGATTTNNTGNTTTTKPQTNTGSTANTGTSTSSGVSAYAQQVVDLVNAERKKAGLSPLSVNSKAAAAAQVRAREIATSFSHTRPDGSTAFTALQQAGVSYRLAGENIAYGQRTPQEVMTGWMNSPGHRANILKDGFTAIGVGVYQGPNGTLYWSQEFIG